MKIIGLCRINYSHAYIAEITHDEIQKIMDKTGYGSTKETIAPFETGAIVPIGAGYDFRSEIQSVCYQMDQAMKRFESARGTFAKFVELVSLRADEAKPTEPTA